MRRKDSNPAARVIPAGRRRARMRGVAAYGIVALFLLAGCAGQRDPAPAREREPTPGQSSGPDALAPGTGGIEGLLIDDIYRPVPGVEIRAEPGNLTAKTDDEGQFRLADMAPGTYQLTASCASCDGATMAVEVRADEWSQAEMGVRRAGGAPSGGSELRISADEFSFSPSQPEVPFSGLPVQVVVSNGGLIKHTFDYSLVCTCDGASESLADGHLTMTAGGSATVALSIMPDKSPMVVVQTAHGDVRVDVKNLEVAFSDPDYAALGMAGKITFTA